MSIINDALKKVQNSLSHNSQKKTPDPAAPAAAAPVSDTPASVQMATTSWDPSPVTHSAPEAPSTPAAAMTATATKAKESKMVYILGVLCLLIALFAPLVDHQSVFGLITQPKSKHKTAQPATASHPKTVSATSTIAQKAASIKEELSKSLVNFNNPAASSSSSRSFSGRQITLSGILAQGNKNVALIDGQVYEAGEMIGSVKIAQINANNVVIEDNGQQRTLKVGQ
jgi:hypothetical protein